MASTAGRHCRACDYDLTGLPRRGPCPECGNHYNTRTGEGIAAIGPDEGVRRGERIMARVRTVLLLVAIVMVLGCGGLLSWVVHTYQGNWLKPLALAGVIAGVLAMAAVLSFLNEREL